MGESMGISAIKNPSAFIAREIENIVIKGANSSSTTVKVGCSLLSRVMSVSIFPISLTGELLLKRFPKLLLSIPSCCKSSEFPTKFSKNVEKIGKFSLGILSSPLGLSSPVAVSGLFLKTLDKSPAVRPFGVEEQYGRKVSNVYQPTCVEELQKLVKQAKQENKKISIIGSGMSQGAHTVPTDASAMVIDTRKLNKIEFGHNNETVKAQGGAIWEQIQKEANKKGKSVIVKQASDLFSVGGSIGINCHGWAHEYGAISSTVASIEMIDANGNLRTLTPEDELFGCMFGTLGYFGVIVSATFKLTDNEYLIEKTTEVELDDFVTTYKNEIKGKDIPLFGGRLVLDNMEGNPLRKVCMVRYEKDKEANEAHQAAPIVTPDFKEEPEYGKRIERIFLQALRHLSYFTSRRLIHKFWSRERQLMLEEKKMTRNEALHPPINAFRMLHHSNLNAQWLQEYFIKEENLANFLRFLGAELKAKDVRVINATIRPTPKDNVSILPYAEQDRYAVVISFSQLKTEKEIEHTKKWIERVNQYLIAQGDVYYQAYMPYATPEQFEKCYGEERVEKMRKLKTQYDPQNIFSNGHTAKYFDASK